MLLDKILFDQLQPIGNSILKKSGLKKFPTNISEMNKFLLTISDQINKESFDGIVLGKIFYSFVSSIEVRDRGTTSRTFEDVFSSLFGVHPTDTINRTNPEPTSDLLVLDKLCTNCDWLISTDVSGNKREKADLIIGNYPLSLKTLKGIAYGDEGEELNRTFAVNGEEIKNDENGEVNMGSLSFRALLKGILNDNQLDNLRDRKGGLGSRKQLRDNVFSKIVENNKMEEFRKRLEIFIKYIYTDDIYIVLKSNYLITWYLIPAESFQNTIINLYKKHPDKFDEVWERWENNNLRMLWRPLLKYLDEFKFKYYHIDMWLIKTAHNEQFKNFENNITEFIKNKLSEIIKN